MPEPEFSTEQLNRYSRHILLPEIDLEGQQRICSARVVIIGAGGLGSPVAMYLAASGVGQLTIVDHDTVSLGNLQRQIAFHTKNIGEKKTRAIHSTLHALNPEINITAIDNKADQTQLIALCKTNDIIIDASDNFQTRFATNKAAVLTKTPLISGAAIHFQGQVSLFNPHQNGPCYRCLYDEHAEETNHNCNDLGVFAPLTGIIGSLQAAEALKLITKTGASLVGKLLLINLLNMNIRTLNTKKDPLCPACGIR